MPLPVIILDDCCDYLVEVELPLTADTETSIEKRVGALELLPTFLVSDTTIEATASQRWT